MSGQTLYAYVGGNPLIYSDPLGLANFLDGGGGSGILGAGGQGSVGVYLSTKPFDVGVFNSGGVGAGGNVGLSGYVGYVSGAESNITGNTEDLNVSTAILSGSISRDPVTGRITGFTIGPAARLGGSITYSHTKAWGLSDLFSYLFDHFLPSRQACP